MLRKLSAFVVVLAVFGATPAFAQLPGIELEPYVGAYIPTQSLGSIDIPLVGTVSGSQKTGFAVGGRVTFWLAGPIGVEGNFVYALSDVEQDEGTGTESAGVWIGDARLIWKILPGPVGLHINGGVALVGKTGDAYTDVTDGKTTIGGAAGAGVRIKLPGIFAIRGDLDGYFYSSDLTFEDGTTTGSEFQVDLVASAGLIIGL